MLLRFLHNLSAASLKCSRCQHQNPSALKSCGECCARLAAVCASCGATNAPEQKFCGECGSKLGPDTSKATLPSPDSYTPKHLAEKISTSKSALEGEGRQLTVLFCDMVGFTEVAIRVDPEVLQRIIRSYEDACAVCITRYEATSSGFIIGQSFVIDGGMTTKLAT